MSAIAFQMPEKISTEKADNFHSIFTFKPLEQGYGATIGNTLRRVLLSSLEGYAITSVTIPGVQHEFSAIEGVVEDVVKLVLNLKQVRFRKIAGSPLDKIFISIKQQDVFKAGDIAKFTPALEVLNPDFVICHLDPNAHVELEIVVEKGRGYVPAEENKPEDAAIGLIPIDAIFTPVKRVSYKVENIRVQQRTDYEKLIIEIQTDGSILPEQALKYASDLTIKHFMLLSDDDQDKAASDTSEKVEEVDNELLRTQQLLKTPLADLGLSVRAFNCLKTAGLQRLSDLVALDVSDMVKFRNFGKKSLQELEELLASNNLSFSMDLSPYNLDEV